MTNVLPHADSPIVPYAKVTIEWADGSRFEAEKVEVRALDVEPVYSEAQPGEELTHAPEIVGAQMFCVGMIRPQVLDDGTTSARLYTMKRGPRQ